MRQLLAVVTGLATFLATPGLAVAHGYAHNELREHAFTDATEHNVAAAHDATSIRPADHHHDHGHPSVDRGLFAPFVQLFAALTSHSVALAELSALSASASVPPPAPFESPPQNANGLPAPSRSPPLL